MKKNVEENLPVFVEFNPTYKLLLVSCLLDQKNFFSWNETYIGWIKITEKKESNSRFGIEEKKKMKERNRKTL